MRGKRGERGSAATETVILTPVLLLLVMLIIQFGLWLHAEHVAQAAAEEGARAARARSGSAAIGQARANEFLDNVGRTIIRDRSVDASRTADTVTIEVAGSAVRLVPGLDLPVHAHATSPVEQFTADDR